MDSQSILVVGTIRDVETTLRKEIFRVKNALGDFQQINFFLVESDSSDNTKTLLSKISNEDSSIQYVSLGDLRAMLPERIQRIRFCRNEYVKFIRQYPVNKWSWIAVVDLDGINSAIRKRSVRTAFCVKVSWDGCFANQTFGYYDLLALRAENWVESDILSNYEKFKSEEVQKKLFEGNRLKRILFYDNLRKKSIFIHMKRLGRKHPWIRVQSAFGGFAFYKPWIFHDYDYNYKNFEPGAYSEHLDLNIEASKKGAQFFINPSLINSRVNKHNINRIKLFRIIQELKKTLS